MTGMLTGSPRGQFLEHFQFSTLRIFLAEMKAPFCLFLFPSFLFWSSLFELIFLRPAYVVFLSLLLYFAFSLLCFIVFYTLSLCSSIIIYSTVCIVFICLCVCLVFIVSVYISLIVRTNYCNYQSVSYLWDTFVWSLYFSSICLSTNFISVQSQISQSCF